MQKFLEVKGEEAKEKGIKAEWWALLAAGFATMAAPAGSSAVQALGQGGLAGMQAYDNYKKEKRIQAREELEKRMTIATLAGQLNGVEEYLKTGDSSVLTPKVKPRTITGKEAILDRLAILRGQMAQTEDPQIRKHLEKLIKDHENAISGPEDFLAAIARQSGINLDPDAEEDVSTPRVPSSALNTRG